MSRGELIKILEAGAGKGGDIAAWPEDLQVREMPAAYHRRAEDALVAGEDHL